MPNDGSIAYGDLFHQKLERKLASARDLPDVSQNIEVINVSCEGYNTIQEVRLLEKVGLKYQPDLVILAYVLNDPFLQNGAYRRIGNSFFLFRAVTMGGYLLDNYLGVEYDLFGKLYDNYSYDLVVRSSFERLRLLSMLHGFKVVVAVLPLMSDFEGRLYTRYYSQVSATAADQGFATLSLFEAFRRFPLERFLKVNDITHPNAAGHELIADTLASYLVANQLLKLPQNMKEEVQADQNPH